MLFNRVLYFAEITTVFLVSLVLFYYYPITSLVVLFIYSIFRESFYTLAIFTFFYDILFSNILWGVPKMSLIVSLLGVIVYYAKKVFSSTIRSRHVDYDF